MKLISTIALLLILIISCKSDKETDVAPQKDLYLKLIFKGQTMKFEKKLQDNSEPIFSASRVASSNDGTTIIAVGITTEMHEKSIGEGLYFRYNISSTDKQFIKTFQTDLENKKLFAANLKGRTFTSADKSSYDVGLSLSEAKGNWYTNFYTQGNVLDYRLTIKNAELIIHPDPFYRNKELLKVPTQG